VADAFGLRAVLWTVAFLPLPALLLALSLPPLPAAGRRPATAGTSAPLRDVTGVERN